MRLGLEDILVPLGLGPKFVAGYILQLRSWILNRT